MGISVTIFQQIFIMFLLMGIGYFFYKKQLISNQGSKDMGKILLYLVLPIVIIRSFMIPNNPENRELLLISTLVTILSLGISMALSRFFFGKTCGISNFSSSFSNVGFLGIPLVASVIGEKAVFYISMIVVLVTTLQWTYGVFVMTKDKSMIQLKTILFNPMVVSAFIGLVLFFTQFPIPGAVLKTSNYIADLNTPLAMMVSGIYLAQTDLKAMVQNKKTYWVSFVRLMIIPVITILIFWLIPFGTVELKLAILIASACPVGSGVAIFANQYEQDYIMAVEQVCLSTILCMLSLPFTISFANLLIH